MIKGLLRKISESLLVNEDTARMALNYEEMRKHPGWKLHMAALIDLGNGISEYMLSDEFTKLDIHEKDAQQRAFHHTKEIIEFLLNPLKGARHAAAIMQHNKKIEEATRKRSDPKGK